MKHAALKTNLFMLGSSLQKFENYFPPFEQIQKITFA